VYNSTISSDDGQVVRTPKTLINFPTFDSVLDFPNVGKSRKKTQPKKPDNGHQSCPSCGGGMDESENYYTCLDCGYQMRKQ
jgi:ribosomal protein S27AE